MNAQIWNLLCPESSVFSLRFSVSNLQSRLRRLQTRDSRRKGADQLSSSIIIIVLLRTNGLLWQSLIVLSLKLDISGHRLSFCHSHLHH